MKIYQQQHECWLATSTQGHCVAHNPNIIYIKGVLNILADAINSLEYDRILNHNRNINFNLQQASDKIGIEVDKLKWQAVSRCFAHYYAPEDNEELEQDMYPNVVINNAFANSDKEEEIFPLTISEISDAQEADDNLKRVFRHKQKGDFQKYQKPIFGDVKTITDEKMKMVIPGHLRVKEIKWFHHYLQHPDHTGPEEIVHATMTCTKMLLKR